MKPTSIIRFSISLFFVFSIANAQDVRVDFLYTIESPPGVSEFGRSVTLLDDVDGDTFPEFAVAASSDTDGVVFLVSSFDGSILGRFDSPQPDPPANPEEFEDLERLFGKSMSIVFDANGDGISDLAVGAPHHEVEGAGLAEGHSGLVYLIDPTDMSIIRTISSPNPGRFGLFGFSVAGYWAGLTQSVHGILIGAPGQTGVENPPFSNPFAGRAYAFDVTNGALFETFLNPSEVDGVEATLGEFGYSVAVASGRDPDFYIGEPGANFSSSTFVRSGRVYAYGGLNPDGPVGAANGNYNPIRVVTNARYGEFMTGVPKVDGIFGGVVVGHPNSFPEDPSQNFGRAEAFGFANGGGRNELTSPNRQTNSKFGSALAGIYDVTGDGRGQAVIGEPRRGSPESEPLTDLVGFAHIFTTTGTSLLTLPREDEPQTRAQFGAAISGTRELHSGPPRRRLIIGAPGAGLLSTADPIVYVYKMRARPTGDLNNDRFVNATDVGLMGDVLAGRINLATLNNEIKDVVDVNNDGVVDELDLLTLNGIVGGTTNAVIVNALLTGTNGPFPGVTNLSVVGFDANPDGDNQSNVFELWRGTDPASNDQPKPEILSSIVVGGTRRASFTVEVDPTADDLLTIDASFSFDLQTWRLATPTRMVLSELGGVRTLRFHDSVELPAGQGFSIRFTADLSK